MKKSSAFMEFLMTYGLAILVVLVAIGVLAYFGVLDPSRINMRSCGCENVNMTYEDSFIDGFGQKLFICSQMSNSVQIDLEKGKFIHSKRNYFFNCINNSMIEVN